ncbi:hypothetical protein Lal_00023174 [Lupinus albus]|nr:hypothetical protein Lal_00023174 [Lupinus albus]
MAFDRDNSKLEPLTVSRPGDTFRPSESHTSLVEKKLGISRPSQIVTQTQLCLSPERGDNVQATIQRL